MPDTGGPLHSPGFWLHHAALAWTRRLDAELSRIGLTHTQFNLLASAGWLGRDGEPPTQQQVADMAGADRMMASKVLSGLEQRGLLVRRQHPNDTRAKLIEVTVEGRALVRRAVRVVTEVDRTIFGPAGSARDQLTRRLRRLASR